MGACIEWNDSPEKVKLGLKPPMVPPLALGHTQLVADGVVQQLLRFNLGHLSPKHGWKRANTGQ